MFSVDGGSQGDDDPRHASVDGRESILQLWYHSTCNGPVGNVTLESLTVDGQSVTPSVYYQFSNVSSNHSIAVTFRESKGFVIF